LLIPSLYAYANKTQELHTMIEIELILILESNFLELPHYGVQVQPGDYSTEKIICFDIMFLLFLRAL